MKILYVVNVRIPTDKAHGIQITKMCSTFASLGHSVELVVPTRANSITDDVFAYYKLSKNFEVKKIFSLDLVRFGKLGFRIQSLTFAVSVFFYTLFHKSDLIFGRDELPLLLPSLYRKTLWETHTGSCNFITKLLLMTGIKVVAITQGLKDLYISKGVVSSRIVVAPDSVDLEQFDIKVTMSEARQKLGLQQGKKIVLYTGHLYEWKGAHILARASEFLNKDVSVLFVGGTDKHIASFKEQFGHFSNVQILGKKSHNLMPLYLKSADVLVLPNSPINDISSLYTSPMKLFEYMASGRPIVASDLPSLREVLDESNAILFEPDNIKALAGSINNLLDNSELQKRISNKSYEDAKKYTWTKRAEDILSFIRA